MRGKGDKGLCEMLLLLLLLLLKAVGFSGCADQTKAGHVTTTSLRRLTPARNVAFLLYHSGGTGPLEDAVNVTVARPSKVCRRLVVVDAKQSKGDGDLVPRSRMHVDI